MMQDYNIYLIVKVYSEKNKEYSYLGVAKTDVDEDGEVKVTFHKTFNSSANVLRPIFLEPYAF